MNEQELTMPWRERVRFWLYERCLAYCVRCVHPDADPNEFGLLDRAEFVAISRDELREVIEEAPEVAWRFEAMLAESVS